MIEDINISGFLFLMAIAVFFLAELLYRHILSPFCKLFVEPVYIKFYSLFTGKRLYKFGYTLNDEFVLFGYKWFKSDKEAMKYGDELNFIVQVYPRIRFVKNTDGVLKDGQCNEKHLGSRIKLQMR